MTDTTLEQFTQDGIPQIGDNALGVITDDAAALIDVIRRREENKLLDKELGAEKNTIERRLGNSMLEIGVDKIDLSGGQTVKCKLIYLIKAKGDTPEAVIENENKFAAAVEAAGDSEYLSNTIVIKLSMKEDPTPIIDILQKNGIPHESQAKMAWNTKNKYAREKVDAGEEIPGQEYVNIDILTIGQIAKGNK